jgi:hypothetical protein
MNPPSQIFIKNKRAPSAFYCAQCARSDGFVEACSAYLRGSTSLWDGVYKRKHFSTRRW